MQEKESQISHATRVLWCVLSCGFGLVLVGGIFFVFWHSHSNSPDAVSNINPPGSALKVTDTLVPAEVPHIAVKMGPTLPPLDFLPGSVEEACGLNHFPPYDYREEDGGPPINTPFNTESGWVALESAECWSALEQHINAINPYLWGATNETHLFEFVVLEDPLTFERIFADPTGDLNRVLDALSRPECLLEGGGKNWELKESCHADAFLNYALINRFCYEPHWLDYPHQLVARDGLGRQVFTADQIENHQQLAATKNGVFNRSWTTFSEPDKTAEQDRFMWKQQLEDAWVEEKCKQLDPNLEFTPAKHPVLYERVMSFGELKGQKKNVRELLIEQAARLGDDAAGLTTRFHEEFKRSYNEEGYKFGRFAELFNDGALGTLVSKQEPSADRFLQIFNMLARFTSRKPDPRDEFEFDWGWVARQLCDPPYINIYRSRGRHVVLLENVDHLSCQEVVHEIRQSGTTFRPLLDVLDKFEQVALELEVYE